MNDFKSRIKELRLAENLTYSQLASMYGKSEGAIRAWETGRTNPDLDTLVSLAERFNVSTDYLLGISNSKKPKNDDIAKRLGLTEKSIEILEKFYKSGKRNYLTLTVNTLIEEKFLLRLIAQYLYYDLNEYGSSEYIDTSYKYSEDETWQYVEDLDELDYMESSNVIDYFNNKKYKQLVLLEIQEALANLLEREANIDHF